MRSGFKTFVSFAIGVLLTTLCTAQNRTTTPDPIPCLNGRIVSPLYGSQYCECNAGFMGYACDQSNFSSGALQCENGGSPCSYSSGALQCESAGSHSYHGFFCLCQQGFVGISCEIPVCKCMNGGTCTARNGYPFCNCTEGHYGNQCEFSTCRTWVQWQCLNGGTCQRDTRPDNSREYCICTPEYVGNSCEKRSEQTTKPPIRCVIGMIDIRLNFGKRCECNPGFTGLACDQEMPLKQLPHGQLESPSGSPNNYGFLIVGVSVGALILVAVILAVVFVYKRRQRLNNQQSAAHARRLPRDLRTGVSHGIYAISGDHDVKPPQYTPRKSPPPYDHLDYNRAGLVDQPPPYYTNPGYETSLSETQTCRSNPTT